MSPRPGPERPAPATPWRHRLGLVAAALAAATLLAGCSLFGAGSSGGVGAHQTSVFHLRPGECMNPPRTVEAAISTVATVPCSSPHTEEVYALVVDHAGSNYPGSDALVHFANAACLQRFAGYVGVDYQYSQLYYTYLLPSVRSWASGDRSVVCVVTTTGQRLTRSVEGSKL